MQDIVNTLIFVLYYNSQLCLKTQKWIHTLKYFLFFDPRVPDLLIHTVASCKVIFVLFRHSLCMAACVQKTLSFWPIK